MVEETHTPESENTKFVFGDPVEFKDAFYGGFVGKVINTRSTKTYFNGLAGCRREFLIDAHRGYYGESHYYTPRQLIWVDEKFLFKPAVLF